MSWFDATGLANIARTALKEAQKTIDKALDIRDEEDEDEIIKSKSNEDSSGCNEKQNALIESSIQNEGKKDELKESTMPTSNWGSFSGSFFQVDNSKNSCENSILISTQPQKLSLILSDEKQKVAPLATPETVLTPVDLTIKNYEKLESEVKVNKTASSCSDSLKNVENTKYNEKGDKEKLNLEISNDTPLKLGEESGNTSVEEKVVTRPKGRRNSSNRNSYASNRLSVVSTESDGKRSSDSVEVLGSLSCTTSPDTDLPSISASSSLGLPVSSSCTDSVEVIGSSISPSSIEVLIEGTGSGRTTRSSCVNSPQDDNSVNQNVKALKMVSSPINSVNNLSPESFEVIPDLPQYDEELSVGDSYTSASESTGPTVLEPSYQNSYRMTESFTDLSQASSKFHSGDSTPDVANKFSSIINYNNKCDILSESIHKVPDFDFKEINQTKTAAECEALIQRSKIQDEVAITGNIQSQKNSSIQASPTKKQTPQSKARNNWQISDEMKCQKVESIKSETSKSVDGKKDFEEGGTSGQGIDKGETLNSEEISGSVSSYSDTRTIIANDSSCEEMILGSSSEDVGSTLDSRGDPNYKMVEKLESDGNHSVKSLLSEAMKEMPTTRETSPTLSEKSRSDLIKVGSEQTSGHTSGDELETTTSSDIEIISRYSPNGDSSSTASRHSPAKLLHYSSKSKLSLVAVDILGKATQTRTKGHQREPSEASSFCSEENFSEVEKLSKRVTELTETLEARESRLNDLRKTNLEMQEKNQELKKEMEQAKKEVSSRLHALQSESEKDELIRELKEEGEKLSKKELKQATLIKTLRAHEKSQQAIIEDNKTQIQNLMKTLEELKSELSSKKESEKLLSEHLKQMNKKITQKDEKIADLLNQVEKATVKTEELKFLLDNKDSELAKCKEMLTAQDIKLQDVKLIADSKTEELERLRAFGENAEIKLENLTQQLQKAEEMHSEREKHNREEKNEIMRRLQEAEEKSEELAQSVSKATRPLLRQMEALQATAAHEREIWEKQERNLMQKLEEAESRLSSAIYQEKSVMQETVVLRTKVGNLEEQLHVSNQEIATWKSQADSLMKQLDEAKRSLENEKSEWKKQEEALNSQIDNFKREIAGLEQQMSTEGANAEAERRKASLLQEQMKEREMNPGNRDSNSPRSSPTLSFGRVSLTESLSSNVWPQSGEDGFETASVSGRYSNVYENLRVGNTAALIESLQSQLKMRDGEISQLQWEMQRRDAERLALTTELSSLTSKIEEQESSLIQGESISKNFKELQTKYDALLEMYGEKVEEVEELRLDLQDVKEMYKSQIDQLLKKEKQDVSL